MKAEVYEGKERLIVRDMAEPVLDKGEVLLEIDACCVCGTDLRTYRYGDEKITPPRILGHEFCGRVVESRASQSAGVAAPGGPRGAVYRSPVRKLPLLWRRTAESLRASSHHFLSSRRRLCALHEGPGSGGGAGAPLPSPVGYSVRADGAGRAAGLCHQRARPVDAPGTGATSWSCSAGPAAYDRSRPSPT